MGRQFSKVGGWLSVWGTAAATVVFAVGSLSRQLNAPSFLWTNWTNVTLPVLFISGAWAATAGPYKLIKLDRANRRSAARTRSEGLCQQLLMTVYESSPALPLESLAVHVWWLDAGKLTRLASFRVERRPDAGVSWTKGKGAVGQCWSTNLEIEADLANLHAAATAGLPFFDSIEAESRFSLTWDDYQKTKRYQSIFVTPLKDSGGNFIGCLSIDSTAAGRHSDFIAGCRKPSVTGLVSLMEQVLRES